MGRDYDVRCGEAKMMSWRMKHVDVAKLVDETTNMAGAEFWLAWKHGLFVQNRAAHRRLQAYAIPLMLIALGTRAGIWMSASDRRLATQCLHLPCEPRSRRRRLPDLCKWHHSGAQQLP